MIWIWYTESKRADLGIISSNDGEKDLSFEIQPRNYVADSEKGLFWDLFYMGIIFVRVVPPSQKKKIHSVVI